MAKNERQWHQRFLKYMETIVNCPNYKGLPIKKKADGSYGWIATKKSKIGQQRVDWCIHKAQELNLIVEKETYPGMYADVMLEIHPTKWKVCQICGKEMSLYYHYPNAKFVKSLNTKFKSDFTYCDHISDIWDSLINQGMQKKEIASFLIKKGNLELDPATAEKDEIIETLEYACRKGNKKCLGPGAMSDFPDRYDGFHTYNRCCRGKQDVGRSKRTLNLIRKTDGHMNIGVMVIFMRRINLWEVPFLTEPQPIILVRFRLDLCMIPDICSRCRAVTILLKGIGFKLQILKVLSKLKKGQGYIQCRGNRS